MAKKMPLWISQDDETRVTQKVVYSLPVEERVAVARYFIGFHVTLEVEAVRGIGSTTKTVAVEGVAQLHTGTGGYALIVTSPEDGKTHDLSAMHVYPLATVRSIATIRRF